MKTSKQYDILTVFDICADVLIDCGDTQIEFGQKEKLVNSYGVELGGSGCIFACQCAKLGLKTTGVGTVGVDSMGQVVLSGLEDAGVDTSYISKTDKVSTGIGVALVTADGDRSILTYMGTIDMIDGTVLLGLLPRVRHLHICSYYLIKTLQPEWIKIVKKAKSHGVTISLDTNWDPEEKWDGGIYEILPYVDVFLPNENEVMYIARQGKAETCNYDEAVKHMCKIIPTVVVKCGEKGAVVYHQGNVYQCPALDVNVKDTVGAGDSFNAGFLYGWLNAMAIDDCLRIGVMCGSYSTREAGGVAGQVGSFHGDICLKYFSHIDKIRQIN